MKPYSLAARVAKECGIAPCEAVIDANGSLIVGHVLFARVEVVVGVVAGTDDGGLPHHRHAAHVHGVGQWSVFVQHDGCRLGKAARRNHILYAVVCELLADDIADSIG